MRNTISLTLQRGAAILIVCGAVAACSDSPQTARYNSPMTSNTATGSPVGAQNPGTNANQQIINDQTEAVPGSGGTRSGLPTNSTAGGTPR
jgi:flagellar hook-length control protein FliK